MVLIFFKENPKSKYNIFEYGIFRRMEAILSLENNRHTFFPIKHNDIYQMYKKQVESFWHSGEIDLSKDLKDWDALPEEEKYFIKMVLAFLLLVMV